MKKKFASTRFFFYEDKSHLVRPNRLFSVKSLDVLQESISIKNVKMVLNLQYQKRNPSEL